MLNRKLALIVLVPLCLGLLTGCTVSDEDRATCEARGGVIKTEQYSYGGDEGFFASRTGPLYQCANNGIIIDVYNELVTSTNDGFFGTSDDNIEIFEQCKVRHGETYKTRKKVGKVTYTRFACVIDGFYVDILAKS